MKPRCDVLFDPSQHFPIYAHMAGLVLERWWFFAQVNHPQNRYYAAAH